MTPDGDEDDRRDPVEPDRVRRVRIGHGANCSSIGSVVDTLFATAAVGTAIFAAVAAALAREPVTDVRRSTGTKPRPAAERGDPPPAPEERP